MISKNIMEETAMDILSRLQNESHSFSKGQRAIARYIIESYDKAAFMTANALGRTVGVSESTVVRFAVELGYDGYPTMQKALQEMVVNRLTSVQRIGAMGDRLGNQDILSMVIQSDMDKLRQTAEQYAGNMEQENEFLAHFRKYRNFTELTRPMLTELVREIRIYEGGRLEILLNFRDELQTLTDYLDLNRDALEEACTN